MRERPILFTGPNVGLILQDRKTQTRRVIKYPTCSNLRGDWEGMDLGGPGVTDNHGRAVPTFPCLAHTGTGKVVGCPYGVVGDRLWVKEAWRIGAWNQDTGELWLDYRADGHCRRDSLTIPDDEDGEKFTALWQGSCDELEAKGVTPDSDGQYRWPKGESPLRWRSSRFMPRWASRLLLELTRVRVERLQDITEEDARAEGIYLVGPSAWSWPGDPNHEVFISAMRAYRGEWDFLNGMTYPWATNPFVWAVTFRRVK